MIPKFVGFSQAQKIISRSIEMLPAREVDLRNSCDKILAQDVIAPLDLPSADNSAMDGFAVNFRDIKTANEKNPVKLKVIETVFAGKTAKKTLSKNTAIRIMTGAPIPGNADTVVPVEETIEMQDNVFIRSSGKRGANVRYRGEDIREKETILRKGMRIRPGETALLAACGCAKIKVVNTPRVAILATGDELVSLGRKLSAGKIRNSNSYALAAATAECRAQPVLLGIARDNRQALRRKIKQGLGSDVLVISGGISMGNADFVGTVIQECGVKVQFAKVRQRPGQPFTYGLFKSKPVFCLPGNPVSALLVFEIYIRPALLRMMGSQAPSRQRITATIVRDICVKPGKTYFLRVRIWSRAGAFYAGLTGPQGSGIMKSMVSADGILIVPDTVERIKKGEQWPIILL